MKPPARHFAVFKLPFLWLQVESESRRVTRWESAAHGCHTGIELVCWMPYHVRWNSQSYRYYVLHMILEVCMLQNSTRFGMDQKMVANHFKAFSFMGGSRSPRWLVDDPQKSALAIQVNQKKATNGQWNLEEMPWALPKHCNRGLLDLIGLNRVPFVKWIDCYTLCEQGSCKPPRVSFSYTEKTSTEWRGSDVWGKMPFVSWRNQRVLCTTPPIASSRTRTAVKGESAREWTSTFIFQAENLHMAGSWANSLEKKKLHFSHAVTPPAVTIWALTFFNRFNGYLMLWKISEPLSRISTYKGNSWGTSKSTFFSTNKIHLPPCWKFLKGTLGPPFLLKSAIVTFLFKTQSPPFSEQLNNPWYVENICQGAQ